MTQREKRLGLLVVLIFGSWFLYSGVQRLLIEPVYELDREIIRLQSSYNKARRENAARAELITQIQEFSSRCFGPSERFDTAQGVVEQHLVELLDRSGLIYDNLRVVKRRSEEGGFAWVARSVTARGRLGEVINLLYLLNQQPQPHLIRSLTIEPQRNTGIVEVSFQYQTPLPAPLPYQEERVLKKLSLDEFAGFDINEVVFGPSQTTGELNAPERAQLDLIARRDPWRRYQPAPQVVRRDPPRREEPRRPNPQPQPQPQPPAPSPSSRYKLTGLASMDGTPRILVEDLTTQEPIELEIGDRFDGALIVMVDYRMLPDPQNPTLQNYSRIILKKGPDYWAVDRGDTFDMKRLLKEEQLPPALKEDKSARADSEQSGKQTP
jgi:hypothetical protein